MTQPTHSTGSDVLSPRQTRLRFTAAGTAGTVVLYVLRDDLPHPINVMPADAQGRPVRADYLLMHSPVARTGWTSTTGCPVYNPCWGKAESADTGTQMLLAWAEGGHDNEIFWARLDAKYAEMAAM